MSNPLPLRFRAGPAARAHIEQHGLDPQQLSAIAGAAGGPKWLVLAAMDRLIFGDWLGERREPLPLVGASIGSWRFAAAAQADPVAAFERLEQLYTEQAFSPEPDIDEVSEVATDVIRELLGDDGHTNILTHPWARLHIVTARCTGWSGLDQRLKMGLGFGKAVLLNTLSRQTLGRVLKRHVYADCRDGLLPASRFPGFGTELRALKVDNLAPALLASGSIPFVMRVVEVDGIRGYRDGGMVDYHMDLPLGGDGPVLMPHFSARIVPGWLDKYVPWRKPRYLDNTLVIHPSDEWLASLPNAKLPDRNDFYRYKDDYAGRLRAWRMVIERSRELADCLAERIQREDWTSHLENL